MAAKIIVEIGPTPAIIAKFEELIIFIEADTKNDGVTVVKTAIKTQVYILNRFSFKF